MAQSSDQAVHAVDSQRPTIEQVEVRVQQARTERERRARFSGILYPSLLVLAVLVLWEAGTRAFAIPATSSRRPPRSPAGQNSPLLGRRKPARPA